MVLKSLYDSSFIYNIETIIIILILIINIIIISAGHGGTYLSNLYSGDGGRRVKSSRPVSVTFQVQDQSGRHEILSIMITMVIN